MAVDKFEKVTLVKQATILVLKQFLGKCYWGEKQ